MNQLPGVKVLLEGASGTGKTFALGTLVDWAEAHNMKVFILFTENGLETILGYWSDRGLPVPKCLHFHTALTKPLSLTALMDATDKIGRMSYEMITKLQDNTRSQNNAFWHIQGSCLNFPDDRTGEKFGAVDSWDSNSIFIIDSLSEMANAAMKTVIGNKPTASQPDYGVAQNNLMNFIRILTQGTACHFVMTAHVDRIVDEVFGGKLIMTKAIGKAIAGDIPPLFSDVIYTVREGTDFYWDTAAIGVDTKTRSLPIASKQKPDFTPIMDKWLSRSKSSQASTDVKTQA
jgi:hypothetical protein